MTTSDIAFNKQHAYAAVQRLWSPTLRSLNRLLRAYIIFNSIFFLIGTVEIGLFISFFALLSQSTVLAFSLALFFLTLFSYFVLRLYLQAKKPDHLMDLIEEYLSRCKEVIRYQEGIPEHHIALANAAHKFASTLHEREYGFYAPPFFLKSLTPTLEKFSCFCHWKDLHKMKEILLTAAIDEHIKVVKCEPTNLEVHAALANAYVMLSSLYTDPKKYSGYDEEKWIHPERFSETTQEKFRSTAEKAIEEFKILNDYAPNDPWVHIQLAYSYHDLQMPEEEIREYEQVLKLRPDDKDTLFKLGVLYFQQGKNAQGLRVYETLRQTNYKKAESLIKFYG
ncbi:MAG: tetratricopeptide repeat protein [Chlamydiales bacterium]